MAEPLVLYQNASIQLSNSDPAGDNSDRSENLASTILRCRIDDLPRPMETKVVNLRDGIILCANLKIQSYQQKFVTDEHNVCYYHYNNKQQCFDGLKTRQYRHRD